MAEQTAHYNLTKPADNDSVDIKVLNTNFDAIDTVLNTLFTNVNDGKDGLYASIVDKGVIPTGKDFRELINGIDAIVLGRGNATKVQVLEGRTFTNDSGAMETGTMPNRGNVSNTITSQNGTYNIPSGYHAGSGSVRASFSNLNAGNVKNGVNIGGVVGNLDDFQIDRKTSGQVSFYRGSFSMTFDFPIRLILMRSTNSYSGNDTFSDIGPWQTASLIPQIKNKAYQSKLTINGNSFYYERTTSGSTAAGEYFEVIAIK